MDNDDGGRLLSLMSGSLLTGIGAVFYTSAYRDGQRIDSLRKCKFIGASKLVAELGNMPEGSKEYVKTVGTLHGSKTIPCELVKDQDTQERSNSIVVERKRLGRWMNIRQYSSHLTPMSQSCRVSPQVTLNDDVVVHLEPPTRNLPAAFCPELEVAHTHTEPGHNIFLSVLLGAWGVAYPYEFVETESVLAQDSTVFVAGEVSKENGELHLRKPNTGFFSATPYGVFSSSEHDAVSDLETTARNSAFFGTLFAAPGLALLSYGLSLW